MSISINLNQFYHFQILTHYLSFSLALSLSVSLSLSLNIHTYIYTPPITCLAKSVIKHKVDLLLQGRACRIRAQIGIALGPGRGGAPRGRWCWVCKARGRDVRKSKYQCASFCVGRIPNSFTSLFFSTHANIDYICIYTHARDSAGGGGGGGGTRSAAGVAIPGTSRSAI